MELLIAAASGLVLGAAATFLAADDLGGWKQRAAHLLQPEQRRRLAITLAAGLGIALYAWWLFGLGRDYATFLLLTGYLLAITPGDMREKTISNRVTALFAVVFVVWQLLPMDFYNLLDAAAGGLCGLVLMGLPYLVRRDSVGTGDIGVVTVCGICLGAIGVMSLLLRAFIAIAVVSIVRLIVHKATLKTELPFAPFLLFAALI